jgi:hypothetical protein
MDMVGASLILATVITMSFEKQIGKQTCCNTNNKRGDKDKSQTGQ